MANSVRLTTIDNPYDPFDEFTSWYNYDVSHGYYSCSYLARVSKASPEMPDELQELLDEEAIKEICHFNWIGLYTSVERKVA